MNDLLPEDLTTVTLRPYEWSLLVEWVNRQTGRTKHGDAGGMQRRRLQWRLHMNREARSIRLTESDMAFIARQITNRNAGGFEMRVANIFEDSHPAFTNLPIRPKKR